MRPDVGRWCGGGSAVAQGHEVGCERHRVQGAGQRVRRHEVNFTILQIVRQLAHRGGDVRPAPHDFVELFAGHVALVQLFDRHSTHPLKTEPKTILGKMPLTKISQE